MGLYMALFMPFSALYTVFYGFLRLYTALYMALYGFGNIRSIKSSSRGHIRLKDPIALKHWSAVSNPGSRTTVICSMARQSKDKCPI